MLLAEALLRRKELQNKLDRIGKIKGEDIFEVKVTRKAAHEGIDDVVASIPKLSLCEVTAEYDHYAKQMRLIDAVIQQTNWTTEINVQGVMNDYEPKSRTN